MLNIEGRLQRLQRLAESATGKKITVFFEDGHVECLTGGECIDLLKTALFTVERFEARGSGHGHLPDLLNDLLGAEDYGQPG